MTVSARLAEIRERLNDRGLQPPVFNSIAREEALILLDIAEAAEELVTRRWELDNATDAAATYAALDQGRKGWLVLDEALARLGGAK